eukprot:525390-Pyramimonas_sp.AAC.1
MPPSPQPSPPSSQLSPSGLLAASDAAMMPRPPKVTDSHCDARGEVSSGQHHRGRVGHAKLPGRCARERARASAAAEMHQPTPSSHRDRRRMGSANKVVGWCRWVG